MQPRQPGSDRDDRDRSEHAKVSAESLLREVQAVHRRQRQDRRGGERGGSLPAMRSIWLAASQSPEVAKKHAQAERQDDQPIHGRDFKKFFLKWHRSASFPHHE